MGIVHMLGIVLLISGLVIFTASAGYMILHTARRLAYHWRRAAHVIEHTWDVEPIPGFIGSMMIEDDQEWPGAALLSAPPPDDGWPDEEADPGPQATILELAYRASVPPPDVWGPPDPATRVELPPPPDVTVEFFEGFPQWQEPTRTQTAAPAWLDEALRAQDDDAALFMSWFRSQVAASRVELAKVLA